MDSLTYKAGTISAAWPFGAAGSGGTCGRLLSGIAQATVLTAAGGTTASGSVTAALSILAPGFDIDLLYHSKVRKVPIDLEILFSGSSWIT